MGHISELSKFSKKGSAARSHFLFLSVMERDRSRRGFLTARVMEKFLDRKRMITLGDVRILVYNMVKS